MLHLLLYHVGCEFFDKNGCPLSVKFLCRTMFCKEFLEIGYGCICSFLWHWEGEGILAGGVANEEVVSLNVGKKIQWLFLPRIN